MAEAIEDAQEGNAPALEPPSEGPATLPDDGVHVTRVIDPKSARARSRTAEGEKSRAVRAAAGMRGMTTKVAATFVAGIEGGLDYDEHVMWR